MSGCICVIPDGYPYGFSWNEYERHYDWRIDPSCPYHQEAAERPWDHTIPWNCPTYYDGCNCPAPPSKPE